ncbi:MAG: hypothetical protein EOO10_18010 [Chitinophagaceae bacterium]|nr:MAG: hypothetical protein EOO10_18010 [Chitinophagaceae bacterium]
MRWWVLLCGLSLTACGNESKEKSVSTKVENSSITNTSSSVPIDTTVSSVKDTASHASYAVTPIKRPSGIYEFVLPYQNDQKILHTIAFYAGTYRLQEEYIGKKDSVVITEGTWSPSQGYIWLYKEQLVRGRYVWKGDTLQYFNPGSATKFSLAKLSPATSNPVWRDKEKQGVILFGVGNEPFWSVEVSRHDSVVLSMPEWTSPLRVKLSSTSLNRDSTVYTADEDSLRIVVLPYFCSDGMSDFTYSNKVSVTYKGRVYQGCGVSF